MDRPLVLVTLGIGASLLPKCSLELPYPSCHTSNVSIRELPQTSPCGTQKTRCMPGIGSSSFISLPLNSLIPNDLLLLCLTFPCLRLGICDATGALVVSHAHSTWSAIAIPGDDHDGGRPPRPHDPCVFTTGVSLSVLLCTRSMLSATLLALANDSRTSTVVSLVPVSLLSSSMFGSCRDNQASKGTLLYFL